ncbi:MAG: diaminopimelate decarboxylase [Candidatus Omnitrophica bacterium]|nr:diaminopimelate decarboxylase [Candidatus Omnitrophota bacterium]MCB9721824.1 diaminopimelate decarboxylase [Candidatus Omnitrophota bacterium]
MHDFHYKGKELFCEDVRIVDIIAKTGTPCYVYSHNTLVDHFTKIQRAFADISPLICFAMKSNDNLAVLKTLINAGAGFDIVSVGELRKALLAGADPKKIVFASVGKTEEEIVFAIKKGILLFNVESLPELDEINRIAGKHKKTVKVALRINPDVEAPTYSQVVTGTLKNKFGIDLNTAQKIMKQTKKYANIRFSGLHVHIGSQITTGEPFVEAIQRVIRFQEKLKKDGLELEYLDIGGGLGIIYKDEQPQTAAKFAENVLPLLKQTGLKIIMEPGRFISGNAGIFVTRVLYLKDNGVKKFLIVDGGMNDLMRPTLYGSYHEIVPLIKTAGRRIKMDVVGPICESGDFFAKDRLLPALKKNDLIALLGAGAYCSVMSSNYNMRGHVPIAFVKGKKFELSRIRQSFDDLVKDERIPAFLN